MHDQLWDQLGKLEPGDVARRAICQYSQHFESFSVVFLNRVFTVDTANRKIYSNSSGKEPVDAQFLEQLCILVYLINSTETGLSGNMVKAEKLEAGQFFFRGHHALSTGDLEQAFGIEPELIYAASIALDAKKCDFGDASIQINVLPRLPVTFVIWRGDEEFDARATILFDQTAPAQLPLDALLVAVTLTIKALISAEI
ncbi:MAG: DUF3786 domain-containing protein [Anaerohalosphaera sp.]|nr:DUF3786 domain-containing protein [Anaerohalosphaera sp.]